MTSNVEELLRDGINRLTAGADVPAGLLTRARRRNRQRRRAIWTAAAAGTAAVTAAAVIAATSTPEPHSDFLQQQDISYVVSRAQQALAGLTQANAIQVDEETASQPNDFGFVVLNASGGTGIQSGVLGGVHADRVVTWTSTGLLLDQGFSADGKLLFVSSIGNVTSRAGKKVQEAYGAAYSARIRFSAHGLLDFGGPVSARGPAGVPGLVLHQRMVRPKDLGICSEGRHRASPAYHVK